MVTVQLLGGASLRSGGVPLTGPPAQRHRLALLALVVDAWPQPLARDRAMALLWPERDAAAGRRLLNLAVHVLRNALGDSTITSLGDGLLFEPVQVRCDLHDLRRAIATDDHEAVVAAFGGQLLDGFHLPDGVEFEHWLSQRRADIVRAYVNALTALADRHTHDGEAPALIAACQRLVAVEPHSANHTVRLMRALAANGERAAALDHASAHARHLRTEFDLEPEPVVARLVEQLCAALDTTPILPSVAVLPFTCIGADPDQEVFAEGMTEDVIAHLAKLRTLNVISRASVMPFRDRRDVLDRVGRALRATAMLDGSVRFAGSRVRIVATLVDVASGRDLWVETYDRDLTDIFAIQSDVAVRIAGALQAELSPDEGKRMHRQPTADLEAYGLYLQGRRHFLGYTYDGMRRSAELFQSALDRDPAFAHASTLLAMANINLAEHGFEPAAKLYERAEVCVSRALALEPESGDAHAADGYLRLLTRGDWDAAVTGLKRALALSPGSAFIHDLNARVLMLMERYDEALEHAVRAQQLDPLAHRNDLTTILLRAGRHEEALRHAQDAVEADPAGSRAQATLGWAYLLSDRKVEGVAALERAADLDPDNDLWRGQLGQAYARSGKHEKAKAVLSAMEDRARHVFVSPYNLAYIHVGLGQHDRALDYLEQATAERSGLILGLAGSFLFADLRTHPRFIALLRSINTPSAR